VRQNRSEVLCFFNGDRGRNPTQFINQLVMILVSRALKRAQRRESGNERVGHVSGMREQEILQVGISP